MDLQQQPPTIEQQILWEAQRQTQTLAGIGKRLDGIHTMLLVVFVLAAIGFAAAVSGLITG